MSIKRINVGARMSSAVVHGNTVYLAGLTADDAKADVKGQTKQILDKIDAILAAMRRSGAGSAVAPAGLAILATLRNELGSLDRVKRLVKTLGMVNTAADFYDHPKVINGFSELMRDVFGDDAGVGARSAVGMGPLPGNIAVEVECIFELR